jgi:hypothetical protein
MMSPLVASHYSRELDLDQKYLRCLFAENNFHNSNYHSDPERIGLFGDKRSGGDTKETHTQNL